MKCVTEISPGTSWLGKNLSQSQLSMPCSDISPNVSEDRREQYIFQNDPLVAKRVPLSYLNAIQEMMLDMKRKILIHYQMILKLV